MSGSATYFLSDLHLGASYFDNPLDAERRVVSFLQSIAHDARRIFLVGDVLDYWYEYKYVVPRGFTRFLGTLGLLSDRGVEITWLIGNHDIWLFDYISSELGVRVIDGTLSCELDGRKFFITHGDGVGKASAGFRFIRSMFRNKICQKLYAAVHPRWTVPLAYGWSKSNRGVHPVPDPYSGLSREPLMVFAREYLDTHPDINFFIFGHRHVLVDQPLSPSCRAIILGDWIDQCSYARFTPGEGLSLHRFSQR